MKLSWGFFASSLAGTAAAVSPALSPDTARLIIAHRLGLSRYHSVDHADAEAIRHINAFGGQKQQLFGHQDTHRSRAHLLVWLEGVVGAEDARVVVRDHAGDIKDFTLTSSPPSYDNDRLIKDLISQAESLPKPPDPQQSTYKSTVNIHAAIAPVSDVELYNDYLSLWRVQDKDHKANQGSFEAVLHRLQTEGLEGASITVVMMPASSTRTKRAVNPWGTYHVPSSSEARRQNPEALLSSGPEPSSSPAPPVSDLEDFPVIINQAKPIVPVRGILPSCFDTMASCQKTTNNCTGHGQCTLLHKGKGKGKDTLSVDCFGCACKPTEVGKGDSKQVTYWGGPACQKKDISVPFWLFVGSGVMLVFLVSSGIGMLYSMGSEELPSVIGAGVSGPTRK